MWKFRKLAVLLAVTLVLESFSPVSTSIAAENVGSEMFAAVEDVSLGDVSVGDALLTDVSTDEVLDEIPADVSGADVETEETESEEKVSEETVTEETTTEETVSEEVVSEEPAVEEPVAETTPEEIEVVEETEAQIEAIETPGNVAVTVLPIDGKTTTFYSGDMDFFYYNPYDNVGKIVAEAFFETAPGTDASNFELDESRFVVMKKGDGTSDYDGNIYGIYASVADKTKIELTFCESTKCGTYTLYIPVKNSNVMAEFNFTIKPSAYYAAVYVNKNKQDIIIYTDGKKKLSFPLSAKALSQDELPVSLKNVKYELAKWSDKDEHVYISGNKLIIDKGFSGKQDFRVSASATDSYGYYVDFIDCFITVTSTPDVPRYLSIFNQDEEEPFLTLEPMKKVDLKPGQLDGMDLFIRDEKECGVIIVDDEKVYGAGIVEGSIKVSGKAIKLTPIERYGWIAYRIEETGAGGDATLTVTSDCGKQKEVFQIHIDKYDNTGLSLFSESDQYNPMESNYTNDELLALFKVGKAVDGEIKMINSQIGNWTVAAKGAQVKVNEDGYIEYLPLQKNSTITLKAGKETKTYNITNTALPDTLPTSKNAAITVTRVVYWESMYREYVVKGAPVDANKLKFYEDYSCTKKLKSTEAYDHFCDLLNAGEIIDAMEFGEYNHRFELDDQVPAGKYTFYVVPTKDKNWEETYATKPFKITFNVTAKNPKVSVRLVKKSVDMKLGVDGYAEFEISAVQNAYDIYGVTVLNGKSGNKKNQFFSYFELYDNTWPSVESEGSMKFIAKEPHPEQKNANGIIRVLYMQMDGSLGYMDLPFTIKLKK